MAASRYAAKAQPTLAKKKLAAIIKHLQAPLKGLSVNAKMVVNDALTASILDNWIVEKDRVTVRPGLLKLATLPVVAPIETIIPFYGGPDTLSLAANGKIYTADAAAVIASGFTSSNWNWTSFANLGQQKFTVMVNGANGVWSWDGGTLAAAAAVNITGISNTSPAKVTVAAADISKFSNGMRVQIAGADTAHAAANGTWLIANVGTPVNTFEIPVDLSAATGTQAAGPTATPAGSIFKETVTAPVGKTYCDPNKFHTILSHMNRLWFADRTNLALYYLPLQQKAGVLKELPLNALFRRGGSVRAIYTWTLDGGAGTEDQLVILSSNGEAVVYGGTDPDADFALTGIFRFDSPMSMKCVINYGGDLYAFVSTGLVPLSTMLRAEAEQLGKVDKNVTDLFSELTAGRAEADSPGWQTILDHNRGWVICNCPSGAKNGYRQMVRFMPDPIWVSWSGIPSRCWQWVNRRLYCGSDDGVLYELRKDALADDGRAIVADIQLTWSMYNTPAIKHFKMLSPYVITDGDPKPFLDMRVDYDDSQPFNQPDVSFGIPGAAWDLATWDVDYWGQKPRARTFWNGVAAIGRVAAPRLKVSVLNCTFSLSGFDVVYEAGATVA